MQSSGILITYGYFKLSHNSALQAYTIVIYAYGYG
jgi:hypothetical protein